MKSIVSFSVAAIVAATSLSFVSVASAKKKGFPVLRKLVKAGVLEKSDLDGLKAAAKEARACRKSIKDGAAQKGSCIGKHIEVLKAQVAVFEKALPKIEKKGMKKKATKVAEKLKRRLAKLEAKAAAPAAPATPPPAAPEAPPTK